MKILFLTKYSIKGASSRLRSYQYKDMLISNGYEVTFSPFFDSSYLESIYKNKRIGLNYLSKIYLRRLYIILTSQKYDLIIIEKECFPYLPSLFERIVSLMNNYILDYDDAIFHNYDQGHWLKKILLKNKLVPLIKNAKVIHAGNEYLAKYMLKNKAINLKILPTVVNPLKYDISVEVKIVNNSFTIGWIGSPSTTKYLQYFLDILDQSQHTMKLKVLAIGASIVKSKTVEIEQLRWSESNEGIYLQQVDVGIMPLFDNMWEQGKCGYKLIQYMASSKPVICSPVGINTEIVTEDVGFIAFDDSDWLKNLRILYDSPSLRETLGKNGKKKVISQYSLSYGFNILKTSIDSK